MSQFHRHVDQLYVIAGTCLVCAVLLSVFVVSRAAGYPRLANAVNTQKPSQLEWSSKAPSVDPDRWNVFVKTSHGSSQGTSPVQQRYRLAGTFFAMGTGDGDADSRKAIIHELATGSQRIVQESETMDGLRVVKVYREHVIVNDGSGEVELRLGFTGGQGSGAVTRGGGDGPAEPENWLGGQRVGANAWILKRDSLLNYYQQLLDDPERLVKVFDSLKPIYDDSNVISGYRLEIEGEKPFFDAVGLAEGDVVRSVNSMKMTSRRRAEYFIGEFVRDRVNAFLIDVDRGGKTEKLMYHVR